VDSEGRRLPPAEFVAAVVKGTVAKYLKSEDEPTGSSGAVRKVVGVNYRKVVGEAKLPFVLLLYAIENSVLEVQREKLNEGALELEGKALFLYLNTHFNEVPFELPSELSAFVVAWKGNVRVSGSELKVSLIEWLQGLIGSEL
jgi:hypothetical protein